MNMRSSNARSSADPGVQPWPAGLWRPRGSAVADGSDLGLAAVGERQWSWPEPGDCRRCFAALIWRDRMLVSLGSTAVEFLEVRAGQALIGSLAGQAGRYSTEVPQQARTEAKLSGCPRTVTCGDGRRRTCCLLMACKRSGVRIPVAPQGGLHTSPVSRFTYGTDISLAGWSGRGRGG